MSKNRKVELSTIIGKGSYFSGNLNNKGGIRIDGTVEGKINTDGFIVIGSSGIVKSDIKAKECLVSGRVEGDITVSEGLEIDKTAIVKGGITAKVLSIHAGALIEGSCNTGDKKNVFSKVIIDDTKRVLEG